MVGEIVDPFATRWRRAGGVTIPPGVTHGRTRSREPTRLGYHAEAEKLFEDACGAHVMWSTPADRGRMAEGHYGAAKDHSGLVIMTRWGPDGPHRIRGCSFESDWGTGDRTLRRGDRAASSARDREECSTRCGHERSSVYERSEACSGRDLIVVGGGFVSRKSESSCRAQETLPDPGECPQTAGSSARVARLRPADQPRATNAE